MKHLDAEAALHVGETTTEIAIVAIDLAAVAGLNGRRSEETRMNTEMAARKDLKEAIGNDHFRRNGKRQAHQSRTSLELQTNLG
jgi:hypothetical protein